MRNFQLLISYIFHPLFIPIGGTVLYFRIAPYSSLEHQSGNIVPIFILTVIVPIIFFLILRNLRLIDSLFLIAPKERVYPFIIGCMLLLMILYKVIPNNYINELFFFFTGLLCALATALVLLFVKVKCSMHLLGMSSILLYSIGLSIHFGTNLTLLIGSLILITGLVASSRLYLKAHGRAGLLIGFLVGGCSQLLLFKYWL